MKKLILGAIGTLPLLISGCATYMLHHNPIATHWEHGVLLQDQLIAVGVPSEPIEGYENALAIAGNKYSYLVKPTPQRKGSNNEQPLELTKILNEVDLNYLTVGKLNQTSGQNVAQKQNAITPKFEIEIYNSKKVINHTINATDISFVYYKPQSLIKSGEIEHLQSLGFKCDVVESTSRCLNTGYVDITVVKAISNKNQLKHELKKPLELSVRYAISKKNLSDVAKRIVLTPLSLTFDLVTSPLQLIGYYTLVALLK